jgi:cell division septation protein DedD
MEKTYFEFKITFLHIVVFLAAVIAIGIFLFYMGYQAGQRRSDPRTAVANAQDQGADASELSVVDEKPLKTVPAAAASGRSIPAEMKLHEEQGAAAPATTLPAEAAEKPGAEARRPAVAPPPAAAAEPRYTIQVGAFADFANAQKCSRRFTSLGYPAAIITDNQKKLHTVQVGSFATLAEAQREKASLEKQEKATFTIKKSR